jgi:hypothetical protein
MFKVGVKNKYIKYLRIEEVYFKGGQWREEYISKPER